MGYSRLSKHEEELLEALWNQGCFAKEEFQGYPHEFKALKRKLFIRKARLHNQEQFCLTERGYIAIKSHFAYGSYWVEPAAVYHRTGTQPTIYQRKVGDRIIPDYKEV